MKPLRYFARELGRFVRMPHSSRFNQSHLYRRMSYRRDVTGSRQTIQTCALGVHRAKSDMLKRIVPPYILRISRPETVSIRSHPWDYDINIGHHLRLSGTQKYNSNASRATEHRTLRHYGPRK